MCFSVTTVPPDLFQQINQIIILWEHNVNESKKKIWIPP